MPGPSNQSGQVGLRRARLSTWLAAFGWMLLLWALSAQSDIGVDSLIGLPHGDKLAHGIAYAILTLLYWRALRSGGPAFACRAPVLTAVLLSLAYGFTDEVHQAYVPGRDADFWDLAADLGGAVVMGLALTIWGPRSVRAETTDQAEAAPAPASCLAPAARSTRADTAD